MSRRAFLLVATLPALTGCLGEPPFADGPALPAPSALGLFTGTWRIVRTGGGGGREDVCTGLLNFVGQSPEGRISGRFVIDAGACGERRAGPFTGSASGSSVALMLDLEFAVGCTREEGAEELTGRITGGRLELSATGRFRCPGEAEAVILDIAFDGSR